MTATTAITRLDVHELVAQLTTAYTHAEPYSRRQGTELRVGRHITDVPALVHQLLGASPAGSGEEAGSGTGHSRPAARIEAVDTLMLIDDEAARWLRRLGEDDPGDDLVVVKRRPAVLGPACRRCEHSSCRVVRLGEHVQRRAVPGSGTIACIRRLHGLQAGAKPCARTFPHQAGDGTWCCVHHHIEYDVRRWWRQARIISGWDSPAWRPDNTCPVCEQRRSLRVSLAMHSAFCVECRSTWGEDEIGLLADHIRTENADALA